MESHRLMMEGQMQIPVAPQPPDQPGLLSPPQIPPSATQRMQVKGHPTVMGSGGGYVPHEGLAYYPPMDYTQRHHHPNQPCHVSGKPYYGQAPYVGQQVMLNPHVSPPAAGPHQPLYFRPGRGGSTTAYPKVQGSPHGWGDYRVKLDQMQMYGGPNQQYNNPALYVNPAPVDPRIAEFASPMGVPAAVEGQRFGSPTHGYPSGLGYYGGVQPIQQYPPYMVPAGKSWHGGAEHGMQRTVVVDPQYKAVVHPTNNVGDSGFPRHPGALSPVAVGISKLPQNYIPGKRLEHFSPGMQGCGAGAGGGGPVMLSPSRQNAECMEEFSGVKTTPMTIHSTGHPPEFPNRHCAMYGPMLSPGGQYRQGVPQQRTVDIGGQQQGVYGSAVYGQQGFVDGPPTATPRCHYPYPKQLQSPHFCQYTSAKCESESVGGQFYGGQELTVDARSSTAATSVGQNPIGGREAMPHHNLNPEMAESAGSTTCHLHTSQSVTTLSNATPPATFTSAATRRPADVLSPSLERTMTTSLSGARTDDQRRLQMTTSVSVASCFYPSSANTVMGSSLKSSPVSTSANLDAFDSLGNTKETVCSDNRQPSTPALTTTDVARSSVAVASAARLLPSSYHPAKTTLDTSSCTIVTQSVSTSTTVAMTMSTAASLSRRCSLVTAGINVSVSQSEKDGLSANPCYRGDSRPFASKLSDRCFDFREFSDAVITLPPSVHSSVRASHGGNKTQEPGIQSVKTEPMFASPRCRVPRAKKRKVKVRSIAEFPKHESGVLPIKLEEPGEFVYKSPAVDSIKCKDTSTILIAKPGLECVTKEPCLEGSAPTNRHLPLLRKTVSPGDDLAPCLEKLEAGDVKEHSTKASSVTVPFGWRRTNKDGKVAYHSPTDVTLESLDQIRQYLLKEGTCKCGLQCPLIAEKVFVFDPAAESRHLCADDVRCDMDMTNLCNHKRKIVAMAMFQHSAGLQMNLIDQMQQFQALPQSSSGATPLRSASAGFEGRGTEFGSAVVCHSSDALPGKFSRAGPESLAASNQKIQQGYFPGSTTAFGRNPGQADVRSIDEEGFCATEPNRWQAMGGASHGTTKTMDSSSGMPGSGPYLSRQCGLPAGVPPRGMMENQHLEMSMSSPRHGIPNNQQHPGGFPMESPGYRMMQNAGGPQQGYGPGRPMWPPYDETRFHGRPGMYGMQGQPRFRGSGDVMWPFRQSVHGGGRVGPHMAAQPFPGGYTMIPEEPREMCGRNCDAESSANFCSDPWGQQSAASASGAPKSVRKVRKKASKKEKPYSSILEKSMPCPNIDVRQIIQEQQERIQVELSANTGCQSSTVGGGPSSSDHLTTFLAQQTVLVNRSLPGNLGCASPADDSDATQSVSTIYGSVDDVASCQTLSGSSPMLVDQSSVSFSVTLSTPCRTPCRTPLTPYQMEKKEEAETKVGMFSSSAETSMDSASRGSVFSSCQPAAVENVPLSSEQSDVLASLGSFSMRGFARSAAERGFSSIDRPVVSSFCSSLDQSNVPFGSGMSSFHMRPALTPAWAAQHSSCSSNVPDPGLVTYQPSMFSFGSNSSHSGFPPNWSSSASSSANPVHSRNQFYFPPRNTVPYTSTVPCGTIRNTLIHAPPEMSSPCRAEQYSGRLVQSGIDVSGNHSAMKHPTPSSLPSGVGTKVIEPFAHVSFDAAGSGGGGVSILQQCPGGVGVVQESRFLEEPGSGCTENEQSPITLVQNMVSGLVTTQNTLAMVTSMIISRSDSSRRRRSGTYSDPTARKSFSQSIASPAVAVSSSTSTDVSTESQALTISCSSPSRSESSSCSKDAYSEAISQLPSTAEVVSAVSGLHGVSHVAMTAVTTVTQVVPTAGIQPSFGPIVQVLNPVNIALPGTSILLNDQGNVLAFGGGQDQTILHTVPGMGQLHITAGTHQSQGQMVVFPTGQGAAMVAIQPQQSTLLADFAAAVEEGRSGQAEEEEAGVAEDGDEGEADDMMRTTGTQTSTPASSFSNCNSLDSGENEMEATEGVLCPDQSVSSSTREDAGGVPATKDGVGMTRRAPRKAVQPTMASILQQQGAMSTAQVVVMPSVQQQPFVLPQGVAFAGALGGQGYLQLQQPVDFGFSPNQVGLIHFGQITAAGALIPTPTLVGAVSVAGGGVVSALDHRVVAPELPVCTPAKSDNNPASFGTAEILHLMSPSMPHGSILVQNMPTFAPFAGTLLPVVPQAALCNIGGAQTIFAVSQGSLGIVTSVASALQQQQQQQHPDRMMFGDAMPEAPDSTVDSEDAISSNAVDADSVVTSTDTHRTTFTPTAETSSSREHPRSANSLCQTRTPSSAVVAAEETPDRKDGDSETSKESPEFRRETASHSSTATSNQVPDDGMSRASESTQNSSLLVQAGPSFGFTDEPFKRTAGIKLGRHRKNRRVKRKRHLPSFPSHSGTILLEPSPLEDTTPKVSSDFEECIGKVASPGSPAKVESGDRAVEESRREAESNKDDLSTDVISTKSGSSTQAECHVTTSLSCDSGDSSTCNNAKKPSYNRASRLRTKIERARNEYLSFPKGRHNLKRLHEDVGSKDEHRAADDADSTTSLPSISYPRSFNVGDLVWGPARGFPSWPGKLVPETEVRGNPKTENGKIWVKWFGDHTFTQAEPDQLKTLSEGLETHHNARKKHRKGRRMNANLEAAIQEAMGELDRQAEQSKQNFGSSTPTADKSAPTTKQWSSKRTKK